METNIKMTIPQGNFHISIDELRKQLRGGNVNVGGAGVTMSKAGSVKVPEGTFHNINQASESVVTGQWYERDGGRFDIEVREMENRGFKLIDLYDGRIGFEKNCGADGMKITVICDWQYPSRPPVLYVQGVDPSIALKKNQDGSVALFSRRMPWRYDMAVCTAIDYLEEKLEMMNDIIMNEKSCESGENGSLSLAAGSRGRDSWENSISIGQDELVESFIFNDEDSEEQNEDENNDE